MILVCILIKYYLGDQIQNNEMDGECDKYKKQTEDAYVYGFEWKM